MSDDRPNVYVENNTVVYRASSLGHCPRALLAARRGMEPLPFPDFMYDRFEEGNRAEPIIMARFQSDNPDWKLDGSQDEISLLIGSNVIVRGHIDGFAVRKHDNKGCVVEAKALGPDWFNKFTKKGLAGLPDSYAWQVAIYMHATGADCAVLVAGEKINGEIVDASKFHYLWIDTPPFTLEQIVDRVKAIEGKATDGDWPECLNEWLCQYPYLHDQPEIESLSGMDEMKLDSFADRWAEAVEMEKRAKQIKDSIKSDLDTFTSTLDTDNTHKLRTSKWQVTFVEEQVPEQTVTRKAYTKRYPRFKKIDD